MDRNDPTSFDFEGVQNMPSEWEARVRLPNWNSQAVSETIRVKMLGEKVIEESLRGNFFFKNNNVLC